MNGDHFCATKAGCAPESQAEHPITTEEFLQFLRFTAFEVLAPQFGVAGCSVTFTYSELDAICQAMKNQEEPYLHYLNTVNQEVTTNGYSR